MATTASAVGHLVLEKRRPDTMTSSLRDQVFRPSCKQESRCQWATFKMGRLFDF